ncbi:MAG: hypothetical protein JOZ18_11530 [Chloroflexi bacterium]|nr:hypothetical protein [Chloroflexota bacterium]
MAKKQRPSRMKIVTGIAGAMLLAIAFLWMIWLVQSRHGSISNGTAWTIPGFGAKITPEAESAQLLAAGITLGHADQQPTLSQQQALFLASQLEPEAAVKAKSVSARYVLLNYPAANTSAPHPNLNNVPVWMVWYQTIPLEPADAAVDPTPSPNSHHDLYVFLDANNGKELLSIWV